MAKFTRDPQSKATWKRMAERWRRCAEKFTSESLAAHQAMAAKRRQVSPLIGPITEAYSRRPRGGVVTADAAEKGKVAGLTGGGGRPTMLPPKR
jgi:hypothetical protein